MINEAFGYKLFIDGLPSAVIRRDPVTGDVHTNYDDGIPVGMKVRTSPEEIKTILYNHWIITIKTKPVEESKHMQIVGFEVEPRSYAIGESPTLDYSPHKVLYLEDLQNMDDDKEKRTFSFTYSI